jgi:GntR family transcriptional regulator/MocR family aminotransferase
MTEPLDLSWMRVDRRRGPALYRQIYARVRDAILSGRLAPGARLPSSRTLASQLAAARGTVEQAYNMLAGEGYIVGEGAAGTRVDPELRMKAEPPPRARTGEPREMGRDHGEPPPASAPQPFQMGLPALDAFPRKLWSRLATRSARSFASGAIGYPDGVGHPPLRRAIAGYLAIARGITCAPEQVFVTAGYQGALGLVAHALLRPGDALWLEDPAYFRAREALTRAGAQLVSVPVDADGLDVARGVARAPDARFAVVTPSHQAPLGMTLSLPRRLALLDWARRAKAWILEDDYDSEFRYRGRPLPALKSLDRDGRVLYAGTFSKVLLPALRLGYLVVPEAQVARFAGTARFLAPSTALVDQMTVAAFIEDGHFARHIKRMRRLYAERRTALAAGLEAALGDRLRIEAPAGGMHLVARGVRPFDDVALAERARAAGLAPGALSPWAIKAKVEPALLISFTNVPAGEANRVARRFARVVERFL